MRIVILTLLLLTQVTVIAQDPGKKLQETAKSMLMQGDFDNAIAILETAVKQAPADISIQKDLAYACYLKRDFAKSIQIGRVLAERSDADEQIFQILGLCYKATASYKEGAKLYKTALKKFPNSTIIYNELGELLIMDNAPAEAIEQWEKGIKADPNYSSNYYNACIYYTKTGNWVRVALYGELFVNLESFTERTTDVKKALLNAWQKLFLPTVISQQLKNNPSAFEKNVLQTMEKIVQTVTAGFQPETSTSIRSKWVLDWFKNNTGYPFGLFDQQQYFIREGLFEAYNQWLFAEPVNQDAYKVWKDTHPKEAAAFDAFQKTRLFKLPPGQNYFSK
ncbi:tetratricopeptide repeat protein [Sediminibacterium sp.]|uniref:tetratricopeptide repeat protein n=1 Tax=Sediminibacterium sp. TaxID=1917865 RepID=UPI0025D928BE|nr:tetratricopeptide repeat protein [Sediminibacterium sp.]MBW0177237.1 tetratricopeptide repeat protein [Sediminibacterium sp.]